MTRKCCLNCLYLCRVDAGGKRQTLPEHLRNYDVPEDMQIKASCYHHQWQALPLDNEFGIEPWDLVGEDIEDSEIVDLNGNKISLDHFSCHMFSSFDETKSTLLDQVWQEHWQRIQDARDRRQFITTTLIGAVTAAAVIASAYFHWLEWRAGT